MGTSVQLGAGSGVYLEAGARGGIGIPLIIEIGVSASLKSSLNAKALLAAGYEEKFYVKLTLDIDIHPLTLRLGLYVRLPIIEWKCLIKRRRGLTSTNGTRLKLNTAYRRMQNAFKQYVELHNCGMLEKIPDLDIEIFDQINDYLGLSNNDTALRQLQFENGLV